MCKGTSVEIKPIRGEADYHGALETIDALMGAPPNTPEADAFEIIAVLVEAYEAEYWNVGAPDPVALIEQVMEARGYRQKDFEVLTASQRRASEVFNRRRRLTLPMIRALASDWKLPAEMLVREYDLTRRP